MVLLIPVIVGLVAGICRAWIGKRQYRAYELKLPGLVLLAFIPQYFAFFNTKSRVQISDSLVSILLVCSLIILLVFSLFNIKKISFWPISLGFFLNFFVILINGGFMPISVETVEKLIPNSQGTWIVGQRLGYGKDIILTPSLTRLWFLSDHFTLPTWMHFSVAFSPGDVLISIGVVWLLWMLGGPVKQDQKENSHE
jgi:hypothetical protein